MRASIRAAVTKNCEFHEALAANYERLHNESARGARRTGGNANFKYLAELHAAAATQLRDVLGSAVQPAIAQAATDPQRIRRQGAGRLLN